MADTLFRSLTIASSPCPARQDLNVGLVSLCEDSLRRRQIQNLTETYITLTLGAVCSHVGLDAAAEKDLKEVETEIGEMVSFYRSLRSAGC